MAAELALAAVLAALAAKAPTVVLVPAALGAMVAPVER